MADNITLPATGVDAATDEIGGVHYQRMKVGFGASGAYSDAAPDNALPVNEVGTGTATLTTVAASATTGVLLAADAARRGAVLVNESTANLYLAYAATASATAYTYAVGPGQTWEMSAPQYTGVISGLWSAANGNARITEIG